MSVINRLKSKRDFDGVFGQAKPASCREMTIYALKRNDEGLVRLGLAVGRRVGNAVVRNTIKRRLRAAFRDKAAEIGHVDVAVVAHPEIARLEFKEIRGKILNLIGKSLERVSKKNNVAGESKV